MRARFAAAGDLHLGSGHALSSDRAADHDRTLNQLADVLAHEDVDTLLLAGDIFHRPLKALVDPERTQLSFRRFAKRLETLGVPTIAITGNASHDIRNADLACALELFTSDWFRVSRTPELVRAAGDVAVCTLPSVPVSRRVAARNGGDRPAIFDETVDLLLKTARDLRDDAPAGWPSILLGHWSVSGASLPNGLPVADLHQPVLPLEELQELGFDACVFGHIHNPDVLSMEPWIAYTGTPHVVDFGETHVEHGLWILDIDDGSVEARFVPLGDRRFVTVDVDLVDPGVSFPEAALEKLDETDLIAAAVATQLPLDGAVIRLRYRATEEQHRRVDRQALLGFLAEAGADKVHGPTWEPVRTTRARAEVNSDGLTDHDALDLWLQSHGIGSDEGRHGNLHALLDRFEAVEA